MEGMERLTGKEKGGEESKMFDPFSIPNQRSSSSMGLSHARAKEEEKRKKKKDEKEGKE